MKKFLLASSLLFIISGGFAQVAIDSTDMPIPHDTVIRTQVSNLNAINYILSDSNYTWNFTALAGTNKVADTFITVNSTPFAYIATYSNPFDQEHKATVAELTPTFQSPPGITIKDVYNFFKDNHAYYGQVGFGANINGFTVPVKYDHADVEYRFPLLFGNTDTAQSQYSINIPGFGYYGERKYRINHVDGWGTLYLPGDTFQVVRVRSELQTHDTIHVDSLGFGFGFDRNTTEYKWLAKGYALPVMFVSKGQGGMGGGNTTAVFVDHRPADFGVRDNDPVSRMHLWPNPTHQDVKITNPAPGNTADWSVYDLSGRMVMSGNSDEAVINVQTSRLVKGSYLFRMIAGNNVFIEILIKD